MDSAIQQIEPPYARLLAQEDFSAYTTRLMQDGLAWWFNMDIPTLVTHLQPLRDFPASETPPPPRMAFLMAATSPEISPTLMEKLYHDLLAGDDLEGTCAAAGAGTGAIWDSGFDFTRFTPWLARIDHLLEQREKISPLARASLLGFKGNAEINGLGDIVAAKETCRQQGLAAEQAHSVSLRLFHTTLQTYCHLWLGELSAAGILLQDASYLCDNDQASPVSTVFMRSSLGLYHTIAGNPETGRQVLEQIIDQPLFEQMPPSVWMLVNSNLLFAIANNEDRQSLEAVADRIHQYAIPRQNAFHHSYAHFSLGVAALSLGEPHKALLHAREASEQGLPSQSPLTARMPALLEGQALADLGRHHEALTHFECWMDTWLSSGFRTVAATAALESASILAAQGNLDEARKRYELAVAAMPPNESPCMFHRPRKHVEELRNILMPATDASPCNAQTAWIRIHCFGELRIEIGDTTIYDRKWRGGRTKTLLKALIVHGGAKVSASRIADLLWPDSGGDQARQNLKVALWRLRHLGVDEKETPVPWLHMQHGHISLVQSLCVVDALQFEHMLNNALAPTGTDTKQLKEALECYRGDFLDSDVSENWIIEHRERLRRHFLRGTLELAARASDRRTIKEALVFLHRALDTAPGDEQVYTQLMRAYLSLGYPSKALKTYHEAKDALQRSFGITPGPTITELARQAAGDHPA